MLRGRDRLILIALIIGIVIGVAAHKAWALATETEGRPSTPPAARIHADPSSEAPDIAGPLLVAIQRERAHLAELAAQADALTARIAAWDRLVAQAVHLGRCEEPGDGWMGVDWTAAGWNGDQYFQGGLGIRDDLYGQYADGRHAANDDPLTQIEVFGRIYADIGPSKWGCDAT